MAGEASEAGARTRAKVIVAIHGVGEELRGATIRQAANQFGALLCPGQPLEPLGLFNSGRHDPVLPIRLSRVADAQGPTALADLWFAEAFWADVPEDVVKQADTLEDTVGWATTVASRVQAAYATNVDPAAPGGPRVNVKLAGGVIEEMAEGIAVLENLLAVTGKLGLFDFQLAPIVRDYVGDVQVVADFAQYRERIVAVFHRTMGDVVRHFADRGGADIYIVAHSEGTVVSFLGLLQALWDEPVADPRVAGERLSTDWIESVRGYMTIGSPIDKHLILWPEMWGRLAPLLAPPAAAPAAPIAWRAMPARIQWRNYYDYGDPIGFRLDTAAQVLRESGCRAFAFESKEGVDDIGFGRYWLPGAAHIDYWTDPAVWRHFIGDVLGVGAKAPAPASRLRGVACVAVPYLAVIALHVVAVYLIFRAVLDYVVPGQLTPSIGWGTTALSSLLVGTTVAARMPRLVNIRQGVWLPVAVLVFALGAWIYWMALPQPVQVFLCPLSATQCPAAAGRLAPVACSLVLAAVGWLTPRRPRIGRYALVGCGALATAVLIGVRLFETDTTAPAWPLLLGAAAFVYLWWLAIVVFDLAFVWHRYIRNEAGANALKSWWKAGRAGR